MSFSLEAGTTRVVWSIVRGIVVVVGSGVILFEREEMVWLGLRFVWVMELLMFVAEGCSVGADEFLSGIPILFMYERVSSKGWCTRCLPMVVGRRWCLEGRVEGVALP